MFLALALGITLIVAAAAMVAVALSPPSKLRAPEFDDVFLNEPDEDDEGGPMS